MLKSYAAIYDNGRIHWLGEVPLFKRVRVVLVADDKELEETLDANPAQPNGSVLVGILRATPPEILTSIAEKFPDPVAWQREQRLDRPL